MVDKKKVDEPGDGAAEAVSPDPEMEVCLEKEKEKTVERTISVLWAYPTLHECACVVGCYCSSVFCTLSVKNGRY